MMTISESSAVDGNREENTGGCAAYCRAAAVTADCGWCCECCLYRTMQLDFACHGVWGLSLKAECSSTQLMSSPTAQLHSHPST
jgi:hypothetical protein